MLGTLDVSLFFSHMTPVLKSSLDYAKLAGSLMDVLSAHFGKESVSTPSDLQRFCLFVFCCRESKIPSLDGHPFRITLEIRRKGVEGDELFEEVSHNAFSLPRSKNQSKNLHLCHSNHKWHFPLPLILSSLGVKAHTFSSKCVRFPLTCLKLSNQVTEILLGRLLQNGNDATSNGWFSVIENLSTSSRQLFEFPSNSFHSARAIGWKSVITGNCYCWVMLLEWVGSIIKYLLLRSIGRSSDFHAMKGIAQEL